MLEQETGELIERRLEHESGEARAFYGGFYKRGCQVKTLPPPPGSFVFLASSPCWQPHRLLRNGLVSTISFSGVARMDYSLLGNNVLKDRSWPTFASPRLRLARPSRFSTGGLCARVS